MNIEIAELQTTRKIVRAVNSHEALLEAAKCAGDALLDGFHKDTAIEMLRNAIAQAEGKED